MTDSMYVLKTDFESFECFDVRPKWRQANTPLAEPVTTVSLGLKIVES